VGFGVLLPLVMLLVPAVRRSPRLLFAAVTLIVSGVLFNRVNVFLIGYRPPYATKTYFPSIAEFAVTIGLIACLMLVYRVVVTYFPVISQPESEATV
jgi:Ni/Fe-hydrogenase subunit HybB-like protein